MRDGGGWKIYPGPGHQGVLSGYSVCLPQEYQFPGTEPVQKKEFAEDLLEAHTAFSAADTAPLTIYCDRVSELSEEFRIAQYEPGKIDAIDGMKHRVVTVTSDDISPWQPMLGVKDDEWAQSQIDCGVTHALGNEADIQLHARVSEAIQRTYESTLWKW